MLEGNILKSVVGIKKIWKKNYANKVTSNVK